MLNNDVLSVDVLNELEVNDDVLNTDVLNELVLNNDVLTTDVNEAVLLPLMHHVCPYKYMCQMKLC